MMADNTSSSRGGIGFFGIGLPFDLPMITCLSWTKTRRSESEAAPIHTA